MTPLRRHSWARRKFSRGIFHLLKFAARVLAIFSHRRYMRFYLWVLRRFGMQLQGTPRYISTTCYFDDIRNITLSDRVVISTGVSFLTHDYSITTALIAIGKPPPADVATDRAIWVGENVFIGRSSIVMPNTRIGENVIIGAGSVIRGEIPPHSIVTGNPGVVVGDIRDFGASWETKLGSEVTRFDAR